MAAVNHHGMVKFLPLNGDQTGGRRQAHPLTGQDTLESAGLASGAVAMANVVFTVWIAHLGSV